MTSERNSAKGTATIEPERVTPHAKMLLALLVAVYTCNFVDRYIMALLLEPLRHEFQLSDSQLGLMSNTIYGLAYAVTGIPMGMLADRVNRRKLMAVTVALWSGFTAISAGVGSFVAMLATRAAVGATESAAAPVSYSLIADAFPKSRRATAAGIFFVASPLGLFISFAGGGYIVDHWGWRAAFLVAGLPGLVLAAIVWFVMKEPKRGAYDEPSTRDVAPASLGAAFLYIGKNPLLLSLITATVFTSMAAATVTTWTASYFVRLHGLSLSSAGLLIATLGGSAVIVGAVGNGWLADHFARRDVRWPLWIGAICAAGTLASGTLMAFATTLPLAALGMLLCKGLGVGHIGPTFAGVLNNAPPGTRGTVMSIHQVMVNFVGFGLGPIITGIISDSFGGGEGLRPAIAVTLLLNVPAVILLLLAAAMVRKKHRLETFALSAEPAVTG